ncbi:hypothetical protein R1flu_005612 [Riccia fluitans]|uniref:Uncharacterized protein n=1 Tax=Riccia fluitans TaxID=41844 RepID=A0ABD1YUC6_9MARC
MKVGFESGLLSCDAELDANDPGIGASGGGTREVIGADSIGGLMKGNSEGADEIIGIGNYDKLNPYE